MKLCSAQGTNAHYVQPRDFHEKMPATADFRLRPKAAWHSNHVTFTPIAKNFMLHCRLIHMLSILCVRLTIKVKVGIPKSFKVGWYPPKKLGRVTSKETEEERFFSNSLIIHCGDRCLNIFTIFFSVVSLILVSIEKIY